MSHIQFYLFKCTFEQTSKNLYKDTNIKYNNSLFCEIIFGMKTIFNL